MLHLNCKWHNWINLTKFLERILSSVNWSPKSYYLTPLQYFLRSYLKSLVRLLLDIFKKDWTSAGLREDDHLLFFVHKCLDWYFNKKKLLQKNTNYDIPTPFLYESIQLEILIKSWKYISLKIKFLLQKNMSIVNRIDMWENSW